MIEESFVLLQMLRLNRRWPELDISPEASGFWAETLRYFQPSDLRDAVNVFLGSKNPLMPTIADIYNCILLDQVLHPQLIRPPDFVPEP